MAKYITNIMLCTQRTQRKMIKTPLNMAETMVRIQRPILASNSRRCIENAFRIKSLLQLVKASIIAPIERLLEVRLLDIRFSQVCSRPRRHIPPFLDLDISQVVPGGFDLRSGRILRPERGNNPVHDALSPRRIDRVVGCLAARELVLHVEADERALLFDNAPDCSEGLIEYFGGCPVLAREKTGSGLDIGEADGFLGEVGFPGGVEGRVFGEDGVERDVQLV